MTINEKQIAIRNAVNGSGYEISLIENSKDGLVIEVQKPTNVKYDYWHKIKTTIRNEADIGTFREALQETALKKKRRS